LGIKRKNIKDPATRLNLAKENFPSHHAKEQGAPFPKKELQEKRAIVSKDKNAMGCLPMEQRY